jgi:hypothetical protein
VHLVGGPRTIQAFHQHGALDSLDVVVLPILLGDGVPLWPRGAPPPSLRLLRDPPDLSGRLRRAQLLDRLTQAANPSLPHVRGTCRPSSEMKEIPTMISTTSQPTSPELVSRIPVGGVWRGAVIAAAAATAARALGSGWKPDS